MKLLVNSEKGFEIEDLDTGHKLQFSGNLGKLSAAIESAKSVTRHLVPNLDGTIKTLEEAENALKNGTLAVNSFGGRTLVYIVNKGVPLIYIYDTEDQQLHKLGEPQGNNFLDLTGANYIEFDNNMGLFDFNKDWFLSVQTLTLHASNAFQGLFSLGDNSFNFLAGTGNYGVYLDDREPVTQGGSARSNTWHDPATLRILLNYNATTQKLEYWTGSQGSNPVMIKNLDVNLYQGEPSELYENQPDSVPLCIGKGLSGSNNLLGQINDFVAGNTYLGSSKIQEFFNATRDDLVVMPEINFHASIGEDTWPNISCTGGLIGGKVVGGTENDFKPVE